MSLIVKGSFFKKLKMSFKNTTYYLGWFIYSCGNKTGSLKSKGYVNWGVEEHFIKIRFKL